MVHALERSHKLLVPGGKLLDFHSLPIPPQIDLEFKNGTAPAGPLLDRTNFETYRQAFEALDEVVGRRLFALELGYRDEYHILMDTYDDFEEWLNDQWDTSYLPLPTDAAIQKALEETETVKRFVVTRQAKVTGLAALPN